MRSPSQGRLPIMPWTRFPRPHRRTDTDVRVQDGEDVATIHCWGDCDNCRKKQWEPCPDVEYDDDV